MPPAKRATTTKAARKAPTMTADHKTALAAGREEGRVVRQYLGALAAARPKPGRKRTAQSIEQRLLVIADEMKSASPMRALALAQERLDLADAYQQLDSTVDITELEKSFSSVVASYSKRKGLTYAAWREVGVPAQLLRKAGVPRRVS